MTTEPDFNDNQNDLILVFDSSETTVSELQSLIEFETRMTVRLADPFSASGAPEEGQAGLVIIHCDTVGTNETETIKQLRVGTPDLQIIVISNELPSDQARFLLAEKIQDWLVRPFETSELLLAIRKVVGSRRTANNRVHAVISASGGAGATTVALAMAGVAAKRLGKKGPSVALFDLDFSSGSAGQYLNLRNDYDLGSVINSPQRIDSEFIKVIQKKHDSGFYLYSFFRPDLNTEMRGYELVLRMLDAVSSEHQLTILDVPYYETEWREDVLAAINSCTIVTALNPPSLRQTIELIGRIKRLRRDQVQITVFINKWQPSIFGQRIGRKKLKQLLGDVPFVHLPLNIPIMSEALERGIPLAEVSPHAQFIRLISKYMTVNKIASKDAS